MKSRGGMGTGPGRWSDVLELEHPFRTEGGVSEGFGGVINQTLDNPSSLAPPFPVWTFRVWFFSTDLGSVVGVPRVPAPGRISSDRWYPLCVCLGREGGTWVSGPGRSREVVSSVTEPDWLRLQSSLPCLH